MAHEWHRDGYEVSTDASRLNVDLIHGFLAGSYWAAGIPRDVVARSIEHSLNFGLHREGAQVGLTRVITDRATYAYVSDVFVLEPHRGRGLASWMMQLAIAHPDLDGIRLWVLLTNDAHPVYRPLGFRALEQPERYMERRLQRPYDRDR